MMNKKSRKETFKTLIKDAEHKALLQKIAQDTDLNSATDASDYSDKLFEKLLNSIKIDGLED